MKRRILLVLLLLTCIAPIFSMGAFNLTNKRNHSEIEWKEIASENIRIIYHDPLREWAERSLIIAEASYESLAKSYSSTPEGKIRIYISDQDDIANGATIFSEYFFIYVNQNEYLKNFSGNDTFLRKVIAHEMSHYFLFSAIADWIQDIFPMKSNLAFPLDINEGYAQFLSGEEWGLNRGDVSLRNTVYSGENLIEPNGTSSGGLLYARGFSIVRFLAEFYGEDSLRELVAYRNKAKIYGFKEAFKEVYNKSYDDFQKEWEQYITTLYYGQAYDHKLSSTADSTFADTFSAFEKVDFQFPRMSQIAVQDSFALFVGRKSKDQHYLDLVWSKVDLDSLAEHKIDIKEKKYIAKGSYFFNLSLSANGQNLAYGTYNRHENGSLYPTIHTYSLETKKKSKGLLHGSYPQIANDGKIYFKRSTINNNILSVRENNESKNLITFDKLSVFENLALSKKENRIALSYLKDNQYSVRIYDLESLELIKEEKFTSYAQQLLWIDNDKLLAISGDSGNYRTGYRVIDVNAEKTIEYNSPIFNLYPTIASISNDSINVIGQADLDAKSLRFGKISFTEIKTKSCCKTIEKNHFNKWQFTELSNPITYDLNKKEELSYDGKYKSLKEIEYRFGGAIPTHRGIIAGGMMSEPLGKHMLAGGVWVPYNFDKSFFYYMSYINKSFYPTLTTNFYQVDMLAGIFGDFDKDTSYKWQTMRVAETSLDFPIDFIKKPFWFQRAKIGLSYQDFKAIDDEITQMQDENDKDLFENGYGLLASFNYNLGYNLPYKNSDIHPVRKLNLEYTFNGGSEKLVNQEDYANHSASAEIAFAPLYGFVGDGFLKTLSLNQNIYYQKEDGKFLNQFSPGIDKNEVLLNGNRPFFKRNFIRGYEKTMIGDNSLLLQSEIWLKLMDDFDLDLKVISISYVGIGLWRDEFKLEVDSKEETYEAQGYEIKARTNVLGFNCISKYGMTDDDKEYFMFSVNFNLL